MLWLLALPLTGWVGLGLEHVAAPHLASGLFALLCALALLPTGPAQSGSEPAERA